MPGASVFEYLDVLGGWGDHFDSGRKKCLSLFTLETIPGCLGQKEEEEMYGHNLIRSPGAAVECDCKPRGFFRTKSESEPECLGARGQLMGFHPGDERKERKLLTWVKTSQLNSDTKNPAEA